MKFILLSITLSLSLNLFAEDPIVAEVNGTTIRKSTLLQYHEQNLSFVEANKDVSIERSLNDLIDRAIGIKAAKEKNVDKRPDVIKKMNDIVYHAYISDELTPELKKIKVTDSDIKSYYEKFPEYKTSQILLRLRTIPSPEDVAKSLELANKIYTEALSNPKQFNALAAKYSQTASSITGGDMGYQPRSRLTKDYFEAIHKKSNNFITKPFRSQYGYHIVMLTGVKEYKQIDMDMYKKIVYDTKRDEILLKYFETKRKSAKIKINKKELE